MALYSSLVRKTLVPQRHSGDRAGHFIKDALNLPNYPPIRMVGAARQIIRGAYSTIPMRAQNHGRRSLPTVADCRAMRRRRMYTKPLQVAVSLLHQQT